MSIVGVLLGQCWAVLGQCWGSVGTVLGEVGKHESATTACANVTRPHLPPSLAPSLPSSISSTLPFSLLCFGTFLDLPDAQQRRGALKQQQLASARPCTRPLPAFLLSP